MLFDYFQLCFFLPNNAGKKYLIPNKKSFNTHRNKIVTDRIQKTKERFQNFLDLDENKLILLPTILIKIDIIYLNSIYITV